MSERFFNSLEGFSLDASRGWKKLASRRIVSGTARSEDNENNRHLFVSSVVVVASILYVYYVGARTRAVHCLFAVYTHMQDSSVIEIFYMRADALNLYHACIKHINKI